MKPACRSCAFLALIVILVSGVFVSGTDATTLSVVPASSSVGAVGQTFFVDIQIADVIDLFAYQFDLSFDPTILSASDVTEGPFLGTGGATAFVPGSIDNVAGAITFTLGTLVGPVLGVDGGGVLARITFQAIGPGSSAVDPGNLILLDSSLADIPSDIVGSTARVGSDITPVPEPNTMILVGAALILLAYGARRRLFGR